jgi:hypothetical protein
MEVLSIDVVVFAPLAPILGVLLFWFIQLLFIEGEKYLLSKIRAKHEALCRFTNFLGILFQTICHALGFTVTKSGISDFYISVDYGRVSPKKEKRGFFEWISNAFLFIGPFFIPASLLLICLYFLMSGGFEFVSPSQIPDLRYTFGGQITAFGENLYSFSQSFFGFLFNIDLFHPGHFGFLLLLIFLGMGIRPSYIGEQKKEKVDMLYDLKNVWALITHRPIYLILLFLVSYVFFYVFLFFDKNWYVIFFSILGWLSIISITSIVIANLILLLVKSTDELSGIWKVSPYIVLPLSYILARIVFSSFLTTFANILSLTVMVLTTVLITYSLLRYTTNKFKSNSNIKLFKKKDKGEDDEEG